jgi:hypothetical protein
MLKPRMPRKSTAACLALALVAACSGAFGPPLPSADAGPRDGSMPDGGIENPVARVPMRDAATADASAESFFINDPPPPMCLPDGGMAKPPQIGGTADCPEDKNREGCTCPKDGTQAACWPGKRQNRNHGICHDGKTTCRASAEFGKAWGPCEGYVLPDEGATQGPAACRCFSNGKWALDNLVPCISQDPSGPWLYSSHPDAADGFKCEPVSMFPPPKPSASWTPSTLNVDCAGEFKLCYTMKAGDANAPASDDCTLMQSCVEVWYEQGGKTQKLPDLPGWTSSDRACAKRFVDHGGYGEMTVLGKSAECDPVNDGNGEAYVFARTAYCGPNCAATPDADGCKGCAIMGSGSF